MAMRIWNSVFPEQQSVLGLNDLKLKNTLNNHHSYKEKSEISSDQTNPLAVALEKIATQNASSLKLNY